MSPALRPRPDMVADLVQGRPLPFPKMEDMHIQALLEGVEQAWKNLLSKRKGQPIDEDEAEINARLEQEINTLCANDLMLGAICSAVTRGSESIDFEGNHIEIRPDLSFHLVDKQRYGFPLRGECKIIGSGRTVKEYCKNGVARFVLGRYAWAEQEGLMIAYVRDGSTIDRDLAKHLKDHEQKYTVIDLPKPIPYKSDYFCSRHSRCFSYAGGGRPGPVTLLHIWVSAK